MQRSCRVFGDRIFFLIYGFRALFYVNTLSIACATHRSSLAKKRAPVRWTS